MEDLDKSMQSLIDELNELGKEYDSLKESYERRLALQNRKEKELLKREELLREAEVIGKFGNWQFFLEDQRTECSEGARIIYGLGQIEHSAFQLKGAVLPQYRQMMDKALSDLILQEAEYNVEYKIRRLSDGEIVDIHSIAEYDAVKKVISGTIHDISERKRAEQSMRESEERYRRLFESASLGIFQSTPDGRVISVNSAFASMFGYDSPEELKNSVKNISNELFADPARRNEIIQLLEQSPELQAFEILYRRKDGSTFTGQLHISRILAENGELEHLEGFVEDISRRKEDEHSLAKSRELYRLLAENSTDGVSMIDREGKVVYISPAFLRRLGYKEEDWLYLDMQGILSKIHPDDIERIAVEIQRGRDLKLPTSKYEYRIRAKSGEYIWLEDILNREFGQDGEFVRTIVNSRIITNRKQLEADLSFKNEELVRVLAEKDRFFSIIAHDLKSPFNGFLGLTQLLADDLSSLTADEIRNIAVMMKNSAANLYSLLDNLLHWTRMQQGLLPFLPEVIRLHNIVDKSEEVLKELACKKEIELTNDVPVTMEVKADHNMIQTIIRNLVGNAIKFTHKGGIVSISAKKSDNDFVEMAIRDNGIGISKTILEHIFLNESTIRRNGTEGEASTGLGLILCKEFVEKHGGKIWVESEEGIGSTFYFTIPLHERIAK
ncbi:MAG: PAS domain-containing sensor histidine kinase [Prolixibacteraceae bacterium]